MNRHEQLFSQVKNDHTGEMSVHGGVYVMGISKGLNAIVADVS